MHKRKKYNFHENDLKAIISIKEMAKALSQANHLLALGVISENEILQNEIVNLENSFYWLNNLAEILNPYLDVE